MTKRLEVSLFENASISELGDPGQNINIPEHVVYELHATVSWCSRDHCL